MSHEPISLLTVQEVHALPSRPWVMVSGHLEGAPLTAGQAVAITTASGPAFQARVRHVELHTPPGRTTIALDIGLRDHVTAGSTVAAPVVDDQPVRPDRPMDRGCGDDPGISGRLPDGGQASFAS